MREHAVRIDCSRIAAGGAIQLAETPDPRDIARALSVAMADARVRQNLAQRGASEAERFSWEMIGPRWDDCLNKLG